MVKVTFENGEIIHRNIIAAARALRICYPHEFKSYEDAHKRLLSGEKIVVRGNSYCLVQEGE